MELLGLFNKEGEYLNKNIVRGNKDFKDGEYIKLATIWIKKDDQYLIQKCSEQKGGEYAVSGGHVTDGNSSKEQAVLELNEELGLDVDINDLRFLGNIYRAHAIFDVYLIDDIDFDIHKCVLQESEVESVHWLTKQQIEKLIANNKFRKSSEEQYDKFIK